MDAAAFGGQVACEEAWAARTLGRELYGAMSDVSRMTSCSLFNEDVPPCSGTTSVTMPGAGVSTCEAAGSSAAHGPPLGGSGGGDSCLEPPPQAPPRTHGVHGIRMGKFVLKGTDSVISIVNVQLVSARVWGLGRAGEWGIWREFSRVEWKRGRGGSRPSPTSSFPACRHLPPYRPTHHLSWRLPRHLI